MTDRRLLEGLAVPRLVGTVAHRRTRSLLLAELESRGFEVEQHRFPAPTSRLRAVALGGGALALVGIAATVRALGGPGAGVFSLLVAGLAAALTIAAIIRASFRPPSDRRGVNLVGTRPGIRPRVWLVAHYDSKGQALSMFHRLVAVALAVWGAIGLVAAAMVALAGARVPGALLLLAGVPAALGGSGLLAAGLLDDSPGAVDNATGVVAVLAVVDRLPNAAPVGVLLTDAEELGLLGASALAGERPELFREATVVNFDGIDDMGHVVAFAHRPGPVTDAIAAALGAPAVRWFPALVDGLALGRVSREAVTILKGNVATMRVVHTPRDTPARLSLTGVAQVAEGVARALVAS